MALLDAIAGCWSPSHGATGYLLRDMTTRENHGRLIGWTSGQAWVGTSKRLALESISPSYRYVDCGTMSGLSLAYPFTMTAWVYNAQVSPDAAPIAKTQASAGYSGPIIWLNSSKINAYWAGGVRATGATNVTNVAAWQMFGICWTGSTAKVFLNGRLDGSAATTVAPDATTSALSIMSYGAGTGRAMWGQVSECAVWTRALADAEFLELYRRDAGYLARELTQTTRMRTYGFVPPSFKAAWASRRSQIIGGGLR